jgi:hypothetical protein
MAVNHLIPSINQPLARPQYDKEGKIKGYFIDPQWLAFFVNFSSEVVSGITGTGLITRTGAIDVTRTIQGTTNRVTVTNGNGVSGNPTLDVGSDIYRVGSTDVSVADGGTGASDASTARTNLGLGTIATQNANNVAVTGGSITGTTITSPNLDVVTGSSSTASIGGILNVNTTGVGNIGAGEDDLITYILPASTLGTNADILEIIAWGTTAANANNKTIKLYFGSTVLIDTGAVAANNIDWQIRALIVRKTASTEDAIADFIAGATFTNKSDRTTPAETLTGAVTIKCTGTGTADNDIVQQGMVIKWFPAP